MGTIPLSRPKPEWVAATLREYADLLGLEAGPEVDGADFETARLLLHERSGLQPAESLDLDECRLEWGTHRIEGEVRPSGRIGRFIPAQKDALLPKLGGHVRLRHSAGSIKAVVVGTEGHEALLMRAPTRRERRVHPRVEIGGVALVTLDTREQPADVKDLSEGGVGLALPVPFEVGESIHLLLRIHGKKSIPIECDGIVTSCRTIKRDSNGQHRVGVRFVDISPKLVERIRNLMRPDGT